MFVIKVFASRMIVSVMFLIAFLLAMFLVAFLPVMLLVAFLPCSKVRLTFYYS